MTTPPTDSDRVTGAEAAIRKPDSLEAFLHEFSQIGCFCAHSWGGVCDACFPCRARKLYREYTAGLEAGRASRDEELRAARELIEALKRGQFDLQKCLADAERDEAKLRSDLAWEDLVQLLCEAAPLGWAAAGDMDSAQAWEKRVAAKLKTIGNGGSGSGDAATREDAAAAPSGSAGASSSQPESPAPATCVWRYDDGVPDPIAGEGGGEPTPPCGKTATHESCEPYDKAPTCEEHRCRCAKALKSEATRR